MLNLYQRTKVDVRQGWARKAGAKTPGGLMKNVQAALELEVLKDLEGYVWSIEYVI